MCCIVGSDLARQSIARAGKRFFLRRATLFANLNWSAERSRVDYLKKVVAFLVDDNKFRKILYFDFPYGFHAEFFIFEYFDFGDAVLREACSGAAD